MEQRPQGVRLSRRDLLKWGGAGALTLAGAAVLGTGALGGGGAAEAALVPRRRLAATDGFFHLPGRAEDIYGFGFGEVPVSATVADLMNTQRGTTQWPAPILSVKEGDDQRLILTNLGLSMRPDLDDSHTIHWHGFRNPLPLYDGTPEMSISVPVGRNFTYWYRARDAGTYMYHCHFEDVEHVQMGMTGIVFIEPAQNGNTSLYPSGRFVYNDGDGSTGFDRQFTLLLSEVDSRPHDNLVAVQEFKWVDFKPDYWVINGRSYPDTVKPATHPDVPNQPISSLIQASVGERILLRMANLGYEQHAMRLAGIPMRVVGQDATLMRSSDGTDTSYQTDSIYIGPGEARDVIFTAPPHSGGPDPDVYVLANRNLATLTNKGSTAPNGLGGMATEVHVYPSGSLAPQSAPNELV